MKTRSRSSRRRGAGLAVAGLAAIGAAAAAWWNARKAGEAEAANPPKGRFITVEGVRLHYLREGSGPVVVLLHGNGVMAEDWRISDAFDILARDYDVIAFDRPGSGYSERPRTTIWTPARQAELLGRALRQLEVPEATVVGHSFATQVATELALREPDLVRHLVVISGYFFPTARLDVLASAGPAIPVLGDVMRYTVSPPLARATEEQLRRVLFAPEPVSSRWRARFPIALSQRPSQLRVTSAESAMLIPGAHALAARYGDLKVPVTIVYGDGDKIVGPDAHSRRLADVAPGSRLVPIAGGGHMIHQTHPQEIAQAIARRAADLIR